MTDPRNISIDDYSYVLPSSRIAEYPLSERDDTKLLVYNKGGITDDKFQNLSHHISPGSLLIFNDTKVIEARLLFQKISGGTIEIFCLSPHAQYADIAQAMQQKEKVWWHCLIGGASKWKPGQILEKIIADKTSQIKLTAKYIEKRSQDFIVELKWETDHSFADIVHLAGAIPLPPYIKRSAETTDSIRYQTIYAHDPGSVAAPTAGLHFTERVFEQLRSKGVDSEFITLHVGAGTFKPVKSTTMKDHHMHEEFFSVTYKTLSIIIENIDNGIVAVGTTTLRTIESLYWLGLNIALEEPLYVSQWQPYDTSSKLTPLQSLKNIKQWMDAKELSVLHGRTGIMIAPGYETKIVKGLITNFHQPRSTLLLLVAALLKSNWKQAYEHALANEYRFLSYGDTSLLWW